jgi:chromosome segregation ATPase
VYIKSPFSQTKNTEEGHSSRLEQVEDRIAELDNKIEIKEKAEESLVKQHKNSERNMQELTNCIKRPNPRIMGIEEEVQAKGIHNIFNKIIENFTNLEEDLPSQVKEASRTQTDLTKIEPVHGILPLKQQAQRIEKEY